MLQLEKTPLKDCVVLRPRVFEDDRGYFFESFNEHSFFRETGIEFKVVQCNESFSKQGVLRGLHFQGGEYAQAKLVRVVHGEVLDVAVDCRRGSSTFGNHFTVRLSSENKKQLFIPRGFAHGFYTISKTALVSYNCDNFYHRKAESGIIYNDVDLGIDWQLHGKPTLSAKDLDLQPFKEVFK